MDLHTATRAVRVALAMAVREHGGLQDEYRRKVYRQLLDNKPVYIGNLQDSLIGDAYAHIFGLLHIHPELYLTVADKIFILDKEKDHANVSKQPV